MGRRKKEGRRGCGKGERWWRRKTGWGKSIRMGEREEEKGMGREESWIGGWWGLHDMYAASLADTQSCGSWNWGSGTGFTCRRERGRGYGERRKGGRGEKEGCKEFGKGEL